MAGLTSPILGSIVMGLLNVAFTLVAAQLMDRQGRKPLMRLSVAGMAACLFGVAAAVAVPGALPAKFTSTGILAVRASPLVWQCGSWPATCVSLASGARMHSLP
jgi:MFS family permease